MSIVLNWPKSQVTVAFLPVHAAENDVGCFGYVMNRLTSLLTRSKMVHVEFLDSNFNVWGVNATRATVMREPYKQFSRAWEFRTVWVEDFRLEKMLQFARQQEGKGFNRFGFYMALIWPRSGKGEKWFCSELVVAILQAGGLLPGIDPASVSPGELHRLVVERLHGELDLHPRSFFRDGTKPLIV